MRARVGHAGGGGSRRDEGSKREHDISRVHARRASQVRELGDVPKLVPPERIEFIPLSEPEKRAKRLMQLSASMGAFPWRASSTC